MKGIPPIFHRLFHFPFEKRLDPLSRFRRRGLKLAHFLIGNKGELQHVETVLSALQTWKECGDFSLSGQRHWIEQVEVILSKPLTSLLARFNSRFSALWPAHLIRLTLFKKEDAPLSDRDVKVALLSSLFTPLRQSVGSCFATSLGIHVIEQHIEMYLKDLEELLYRMRITRVIGEKEYRAPINLKIGPRIPPTLPSFTSFYKWRRSKRLSRNYQTLFDHAFGHHPLLKVWEYTLASMSDFQSEFSKHNDYHSLGLDPKQPNGLGEVIFQLTEEKYNALKKEHDALQEQIDTTSRQMDVSVDYMRRATDFERLKRFQSQIHSGDVILHGLEAEQKDLVEEINALADFSQNLIDEMLHQFPLYFQEIYDPDLLSQEALFVEDQPAGFRLVFKGGNLDPLAWHLIEDAKQYSQSLADFFRALEPIAQQWQKRPKLQEHLEEVMIKLNHHVFEPHFIQGAIERLSSFHQRFFPLTSPPTPWCYHAGGSLSELIRSYYATSSLPKAIEKEYEEPASYLVDLIEMFKDRLGKKKRNGYLAYSPTHAFRILPNLESFKGVWERSDFTYTYVRDHFQDAGRNLYTNITLTAEEAGRLEKRLTGQMKCHWMAQNDLSSLDRELTRHYPGIPLEDRESFYRKTLPAISREELLLRFPNLALPPHTLSLFFDELYNLLDPSARKEHLPPPPTLLFADTNWPFWYFGISTSPITHQLKLWRLDEAGYFGHPMPEDFTKGPFGIYPDV